MSKAKNGDQELEIDFENFQVEDDKANHIRLQLGQLKVSQLVVEAKQLVAELGTQEASVDESGQSQMPSLGGEIRALSLHHDGRLLRVELEGSELRIKDQDGVLVHVLLLPKDDEFVVMSCAQDWETRFETWAAVWKETAGQAKRSKTDRSKAFKARFASP